MNESSDEKIKEIRQDKLEKLIEQKVEEKNKEKDQKIKELETKIEKLKTNSNTIKKPSTSKNKMSRREFLKKAGLGTAGLAALTSPISALDIKDSNGLNIFTEGTQNFDVGPNGDVNIPNGQLNIQGNTAATQNWANNQGWITANQAPVQSVNGKTGEVEVSNKQPITRTQEAETFREENISFEFDNTVPYDGSVILESDGATASRSSDTGTKSTGRAYGLEINPNRLLAGVNITVSSNTGNITDVRLFDPTKGELLWRETGSWSGGDVISLYGRMEAERDYYVVVGDSGNSYTVGQYETIQTYPYNSTDIDIIAGSNYNYNDSSYSGGGSGYIRGVNKIVPILPSSSGAENVKNDGSVIVEWPSEQVYSWDIVTYQRETDGETVNVYVAESSDEGSTWSRINSGNPVTRNFDISNISSTNKIRAEVEMSRTDSLNNPELNYFARRIVK